jgi:two-component system, chemotaxis family, CheB/CheR fusion protein
MPGRYTPPPTDRFRVLIVEDHEDTRDLIHQLLEIAGALVTGAASADLALQAAAQGKFDVVLTDVGLGHSKQDGVWLLQRFAATPDLADIPFIALTGRKERKDELVAAGFTAVLIKPIEVEDVAAVVLGVARRHLHR